MLQVTNGNNNSKGQEKKEKIVNGWGIWFLFIRVSTLVSAEASREMDQVIKEHV